MTSPTRIQSTRFSSSAVRSSGSSSKSVQIMPSQRCQLNTQFIQPRVTHQPVTTSAAIPAR